MRVEDYEGYVALMLEDERREAELTRRQETPTGWATAR